MAAASLRAVYVVDHAGPIHRIDMTRPLAMGDVLDQPGVVGEPVQFSAALSSFPDGRRHFRWDFDGDGVVDEDSGADPDIEHTYSEPFHGMAIVEAVDSDGEIDRDQMAVDVRPAPPSAPETDQGDAVLDTADPKVVSATASTRIASSAKARSSRRRKLRVRLRAKDRGSGVAVMQLTQNRRRPGKWRKFHARTRFSARRARPLYVRVRDRAGNESRWRRVRLKRRRGG